MWRKLCAGKHRIFSVFAREEPNVTAGYLCYAAAQESGNRLTACYGLKETSP